ncbi:hypothetical protein Bbelb_026860 [Branchiostoma belcheri]|nr:hypothetical protein Bbelb_026860 [Branchiostoma belcheri]
MSLTDDVQERPGRPSPGRRADTSPRPNTSDFSIARILSDNSPDRDRQHHNQKPSVYDQQTRDLHGFGAPIEGEKSGGPFSASPRTDASVASASSPEVSSTSSARTPDSLKSPSPTAEDIHRKKMKASDGMSNYLYAQKSDCDKVRLRSASEAITACIHESFPFMCALRSFGKFLKQQNFLGMIINIFMLPRDARLSMRRAVRNAPATSDQRRAEITCPVARKSPRGSPYTSGHDRVEVTNTGVIDRRM